MVNATYRAVTKAAVFTARVDQIIADGKVFGFDIESGYHGKDTAGRATDVSHPDWSFTGFSYANSEDWADYVPVAHDDESLNVDDKVQVARDLWRLLQTGRAIAHNAFYELIGTGRWFREMLSDDPEYGESVRASDGLFPIYGDSMLLAFNLDSWHGVKYQAINAKGEQVTYTVGKGLKPLVLNVLQYKMIEFDELFEGMNIPSKSRRFNVLDTSPKVVKYACEDSIYCLKLFNHFIEEEVKPDIEEGMFDLTTYKIDLQLLPVVVRMERVGIPLDWDYLRKKYDEALLLEAEMNDEILETMSGKLNKVVNINLGSPKQVANTLYNELGIQRPMMQGKESDSTAEKALGAISKSEPIVRDILTYRTVKKMVSSYLHKYLTELDYLGDGRVWPSHNTTGAVTGRFSVTGMTYQQLPKPYFYKLKNGREFHLSFRDAIKAPEGKRIVGFDYSQIQLRAMAGFAQEKAMLEAFATGVDIHIATASSMLKIPLEKINKADRSKGKTLNFAITFGQGPDQLAADLTTEEEEVTVQAAQGLLKKYFEGFPSLKGWMDTVKYDGGASYVRGLFGRRYKIWEFLSDLRSVRNKGDRMAVNEPVQGAEAYYVKLAMIRADKAIRAAGMQDKIQTVMMVHDALEFYVDNSVSTQYVIDLLQDAVVYNIPKYMEGFPVFKADWHEGHTLGSVVEVDIDENHQITGYNLSMEVKGAEKQYWEADTFEAVNAAYEHWRATEHPEVLSKQKQITPLKRTEEFKQEEVVSEHIMIQVKNDLTKENLKNLKNLLDGSTGNNKVTLVTKTRTVDFPGTYGINMKSQPIVNLALGSVHMYNKNEEAPF